MLRQTAKKAFLGLRKSTASPSTGLGHRLYHENVIDHCDNPRNVGSLTMDDPNVGTGYVGSPACGDLMKLQIMVNDFASEWIKGKTIEEVLTIKNAEIAKHLWLPPVKLHCSMLAEDTIKSTVQTYKEKQANANALVAGKTAVA